MNQDTCTQLILGNNACYEQIKQVNQEGISEEVTFGLRVEE